RARCIPHISSSIKKCCRGSRLGDRSPLLVFADDWGRHPSSCQHLIAQLLGRRQVYWVNTIGMRNPRLDLATARRAVEKLGGWFRRPKESSNGELGPRVVNPRMWPWFSSSWGRGINKRLLGWQLGGLVQSFAEPPIVVTTIPIVADLMGVLPA